MPKSKQSDGLGANRRPVQVCRYDLPLKRHGRNQRLSVAMLEKQGYADYLDSKDLEFVASRFRQVCGWVSGRDERAQRWD